MINLLRGEFYKLQKSKCFYGCCFVMAVIVLLFYGSFLLVEKIQQGEVANGTYGLVVEVEGAQESVSVWDDTGILDMEQTMFESIGSLIAAIFASCFVFGEYANGAVKNVVGKGYSRWKIFSAKYIATIVGTIIIEMVMLLSVLVCDILFVGKDRINQVIFADFCSYAGIQLLLVAALTGIIVLISQLCRNQGAAISISICMIVFSNYITCGLDALLYYFKFDIKASDYWILDLIPNYPVTEPAQSLVIRTVVCAIVCFGFALIVGILHFKKADVK